MADPITQQTGILSTVNNNANVIRASVAQPTFSPQAVEQANIRSQQAVAAARQRQKEKQQGEDVSSLISPQAIAGLINTLFPLAFGDQSLNADQQLIQSALQSTLAKLYKEKANLIEEEAKLRAQHSINLEKIEQQHQPTKEIVNGQTVDGPPELSDEEYNIKKANENARFTTALDIIQKRKDKNQKDIDNIVNDPFAKQKEELKKFQQQVTVQKSKRKLTFNKSRKARRKAILKNVAKSLLSVLPLLLVDKIGDIIAQNDKISDLVNKANAIIEEANQSNDPTKLNNARLVRNNAITVIQNNEDKIIKINNLIKRIAITINIFNVSIAIASAIINVITNLPTPVAPILAAVVRLLDKLNKLIVKIQPIIAALSAFLPIIILMLESAINTLEDYKAQLLKVNGTLEEAAALSPISLSIEFGDGYGSYKGFKFAVREETKGAVRGNKRHYAVAIDTNNVEVLKSESSFTLDPNDLIDQLKLIIDRENLIG